MLAGLAGGVVVVMGGLASGERAFEVFAHFDTPQRMSAFVGAALYLGVSGLFGILFGIARGAWSRLPAPTWLVGLGYGIVLLGFDLLVVARGAEATLSAIPSWSLAASHLVFGAMLGWLIGRVEL